METCDAIRETLCEYLDGEAAAEARAAVESHLKGCPNCRQELDDLRMASAAVRELPRRAAPHAVLAGVREQLRAEQAGSPRVIRAGEAFEKHGERPWRTGLISLAAFLMVGVVVYLAVAPGVPQEKMLVSPTTEKEERIEEAAAALAPKDAAVAPEDAALSAEGKVLADHSDERAEGRDRLAGGETQGSRTREESYGQAKELDAGGGQARAGRENKSAGDKFEALPDAKPGAPARDELLRAQAANRGAEEMAKLAPTAEKGAARKELAEPGEPLQKATGSVRAPDAVRTERDALPMAPQSPAKQAEQARQEPPAAAEPAPRFAEDRKTDEANQKAAMRRSQAGAAPKPIEEVAQALDMPKQAPAPKAEAKKESLDREPGAGSAKRTRQAVMHVPADRAEQTAHALQALAKQLGGGPEMAGKSPTRSTHAFGAAGETQAEQPERERLKKASETATRRIVLHVPAGREDEMLAAVNAYRAGRAAEWRAGLGGGGALDPAKPAAKSGAESERALAEEAAPEAAEAAPAEGGRIGALSAEAPTGGAATVEILIEIIGVP